jgi:hypothetical protein
VLDEREALTSPSPSGSEKTSAFEQVSSGLFGIFGGSENKKETPSGFNRVRILMCPTLRSTGYVSYFTTHLMVIFFSDTWRSAT